jgi:hypothetical protein
MMIVRKQRARVLAQKVEMGQYTWDEAVATARALLYETPRAFGMVDHS